MGDQEREYSGMLHEAQNRAGHARTDSEQGSWATVVESWTALLGLGREPRQPQPHQKLDRTWPE
jgi:hypothetical protein